MQKTILLVLVISLLSIFFQQAVANDVRFCLSETDASAAQVYPTTAATAAGDLTSFYSVATNKAGTFLWAVYNSGVFRFQVDTTTGNLITSSKIRIGKSSCTPARRAICDPYTVYVDSLDRLWVVDNGLRRVLQWNNASLADFSGIFERPVKVIGASDYLSWNSAGSVSAFNLSGPQSVTYYEDTDTLWILDANQFGNGTGTAARALRYDLISQQPSGGVEAQAVLGQSSLTSYSTSTSVSSSRFGYAEDLTVDQTNGDLYVADSFNNRVLLFTSAQGKDSGSSATRVIGQTSTSKNSAATSNKGLKVPVGLYLDTAGDQLFITDHGNNRVVVVSKVSDFSNGPEFTTVIGQASFDAGSANQNGSIALNTLSGPYDVDFNNATGFISVADFGNKRLSVYGPCTSDKTTPGITPSPASATASLVIAASVTASRSTGASQDPSVSFSASPATLSPTPTEVFFTTTGGSGSTGSTGRVTTGARR